MALECGRVQKETAMSVNGDVEKQMAMEFIFGSMEIITKDSLGKMLNMEKGRKNSVQEIFTKDHFYWENQMVMVSIFGQTAAFTKAISKTVSEMVMEYGKNQLELVINMKVTIFMIKNKAMVFSLGKMATLIKVTT